MTPQSAKKAKYKSLESLPYGGCPKGRFFYFRGAAAPFKTALPSADHSAPQAGTNLFLRPKAALFSSPRGRAPSPPFSFCRKKRTGRWSGPRENAPGGQSRHFCGNAVRHRTAGRARFDGGTMFPRKPLLFGREIFHRCSLIRTRGAAFDNAVATSPPSCAQRSGGPCNFIDSALALLLSPLAG